MELNLSRLKRFDPDKHEQLIGLLQWCQLMGLTGKDLVSLGGHISRIQVAEQARTNVALVDGLECQPIGQDKTSNMDQRWKYRQGDIWFHFQEQGGYGSRIKVTNTKTKMTKIFNPGYYELGRKRWRTALRYRAMLDVVNGKILLDF